MTNARATNPTLITLASAFRISLIDDAAGIRAIDRAVEHLASGLDYEFDGCELRVTSYSRRHEGCVQVTDGVACTCESAHRTHCWHRSAFRLLLADLALRNPMELRYNIAEQYRPEPADVDGYDDQGDFLAQPAREIAPVAGSRWAQAQSAADAYFA